MKTISRIVCGVLIAAPLFLAPTRSRAGGFTDLFGREREHRDRDGHNDDHDRRGGWDNNTNNAPAPAAGDPPAGTPAGNSVPINGGLIVLMAAGLGLATRIMNGKNKVMALNRIV